MENKYLYKIKYIKIIIIIKTNKNRLLTDKSDQDRYEEVVKDMGSTNNNFFSILLIFIYIFPDSILRKGIGLPFILFFPSYSLISFLFPERRGLDIIERSCDNTFNRFSFKLHIVWNKINSNFTKPCNVQDHILIISNI